MRVFIAGGSGVVGSKLIPLLVAHGHQVIATTRTAAKAGHLQTLGAEPVVVNALDREAVRNAVISAKPDVLVHQLTALASMRSVKKLDEEVAVTNRLRTEGTDYLIEAARSAGTRSFIAQSYIGTANIREGGRIKTEDDPLDPNPPKAMRQTVEATRYHEKTVSSLADMRSVVLRYGSFYGPGTAIAADGEIVKRVRLRQFPIVGNGAGVWSFVHMDDVAEATRLAIEGGPAGMYNIVDDEPAEVSVWLPELAKAVGAKPPYHVPAWLGRLMLGDVGVSMMTQIRGSSNAKAKRILNWRLMYPTWREGFRRSLAAEQQPARRIA